MPELVRLPSDCTADDMLEVSERDGGVIVEGWLPAELLDRFNAQLDPLLDAVELPVEAVLQPVE